MLRGPAPRGQATSRSRSAFRSFVFRTCGGLGAGQRFPIPNQRVDAKDVDCREGEREREGERDRDASLGGVPACHASLVRARDDPESDGGELPSIAKTACIYYDVLVRARLSAFSSTPPSLFQEKPDAELGWVSGGDAMAPLQG